jgi:DNA polymerase III subunit chi
VAEVAFYHLTRTRLEQALPSLLEKTLQRGWRAVVRVGSEERLRALDDHLWTYREESFLPHGTAGDGSPENQPILLTLGEGCPNGATVVFAVDGAELPAPDGFERLILVFDSDDDEAIQRARSKWAEYKAAGTPVSYWKQDEDGRWAQAGTKGD